MEGVRWLQQLFGPDAYPWFLVLTYFGSSAVLWGLIGILYWLVSPRLGRRLAVVVGLGFVVNQILKDVIETPRPYDLDPVLATRFAQSTGGGGGFPSGHTQNAATFWPALAVYFGRRWIWGVSLALIVAVAASRLYLGVHSPVDVIGGTVIGLLLALYSPAFDAPLPRRRIWGAVVVAAGLGLSLVHFDPRGLGFLAGVLVAAPAFRPPRTPGRGLVLGVGGALMLLLLHLAVRELLPAAWRESPAGTYLRFLALTLFAAEAWPRLLIWAGLLAPAGAHGGPQGDTVTVRG
ncbi:MAG TPA: phosphatase PAP2 family protein [Thermoanaerobaculia bacterium]|nr:phosphatase PAP2 family protein [Thermoanaerobaculia bacterium]